MLCALQSKKPIFKKSEPGKVYSSKKCQSEKMGALEVPQIHCQRVLTSVFFYVRGESGVGNIGRPTVDIWALAGILNIFIPRPLTPADLNPMLKLLQIFDKQSSFLYIFPPSLEQHHQARGKVGILKERKKHLKPQAESISD